MKKKDTKYQKTTFCDKILCWQCTEKKNCFAMIKDETTERKPGSEQTVSIKTKSINWNWGNFSAQSQNEASRKFNSMQQLHKKLFPIICNG